MCALDASASAPLRLICNGATTLSAAELGFEIEGTREQGARRKPKGPPARPIDEDPGGEEEERVGPSGWDMGPDSLGGILATSGRALKEADRRVLES